MIYKQNFWCSKKRIQFSLFDKKNLYALYEKLRKYENWSFIRFLPFSSIP